MNVGRAREDERKIVEKSLNVDFGAFDLACGTRTMLHWSAKGGFRQFISFI